MIYTAEELFKLRLPADADLADNEVGALLLRAEIQFLILRAERKSPNSLPTYRRSLR